MHWRRFRVADIPTKDEKVFSDWLLARWREKDELLEYFVDNNRFPADTGITPNVNGGEPMKGAGWIETEVRPTSKFEFLTIFIPLATVALVVNVFLKMKAMVFTIMGTK